MGDRHQIRWWVKPPPPEPVDLTDLKKAELVELAQEQGVDESGTKAEIIERLEEVES